MGCGCIAAMFAVAVPRLTLFLMWVFSDRLKIAFDSFVVPFLGFLLLPYATVFYALCYAPVRGVTGFGWIIVIFGVFLDISSYTGGEYSRRQRASAV